MGALAYLRAARVLEYNVSGYQAGKYLLPGCYVGSTGKYELRFFTSTETLIYARTNGSYSVALIMERGELARRAWKN